MGPYASYEAELAIVLPGASCTKEPKGKACAGFNSNECIE